MLSQRTEIVLFENGGNDSKGHQRASSSGVGLSCLPMMEQQCQLLVS